MYDIDEQDGNNMLLSIQNAAESDLIPHFYITSLHIDLISLFSSSWIVQHHVGDSVALWEDLFRLLPVLKETWGEWAITGRYD